MTLQHQDIPCLAVDLPENIQREKWAGHYDLARRIIEKRLTWETSPAMIKRLELERLNLDFFERYYIVSREDALKEIQESVPDFTDEELTNSQMAGQIDYVYRDGKEAFGKNAASAFLKSVPALWARCPADEGGARPVLDNMIASLTPGQEYGAHIHLRHEVWVEEDQLEEGKPLRIHIPVPCQRGPIHNLQILTLEPKPEYVPAKDSKEDQPAAYFCGPAQKGQVFTVEYAFDNRERYVDLTAQDPAQVQGAIPEDAQPYLAEELPHIAFTPYMKSLAEEIRGTETNLLLVARRIYDFVTTQVHYWFVRDYAGIDNLSQYCALGRHGDCGVQALTFMTLCRICGIPAKWESGIDAKPQDIGAHDWCRFYLPGLGWLGCDCSYGGSAYDRGETARWNYYFGNLDPFRIPINDGFQKDFARPKTFWRNDPYDNQYGEGEYEDRGLYGRQVRHRYIDKGIRLL